MRDAPTAWLLAAALFAGCDCGYGGPSATPAGAGPGATGHAVATPAADAPGLFTDITIETGIDHVQEPGATGAYHPAEITGTGCGLLDFDNDGRLDAYLVNGARSAATARDRLLRQTADGRFEDVTDASGLRPGGYGMGVTAGDYDNDGDVDLYLTNVEADELWRNEGDGTFVDVTAESGIDNPAWSVSAAFLDYDRDGRLDLFVANYLREPASKECPDNVGLLDYCAPQNFDSWSDKLYRGQPDGTFRDVSAEAGIAGQPGPGLGVICADFDGDGWTDVYVANDQERNFLWLNQGDGTFVDKAVSWGCAYNRDGEAEAGMGLTIGDTNDDGLRDLFVTHFSEETNTLYRGLPGGGFHDASDRSRLGPPSLRFTGFGTALLDLECDGDLDVVVVNGSVRRKSREIPSDLVTDFWRPYAEPNQLFLNDGAGIYEDASTRAGPLGRQVEVSRGLATGDIDGDGDLDLLVSNTGGPARLYRNDAPREGRWLIVRAYDPALRRDALGAEVTVHAGGRTFHRTVIAAYSIASTNDPRAHFGLGDVESVDAVEIRWPDGSMERFPGAPHDTAVQFNRGDGS